MSDLEILEETAEEVVETPIEEEIVEIPQRVNDFCVISKFTWENGGRDIQTNSGWSENPYGEDYAIVPDEMVPDIKATQGFCDIVLSEDGTEVVSFTAREIPEFPEQEPGPTAEERIAELEGQISEMEAYQLEQDNMILDNNFAILMLQEGIGDIV